MFSPIIRFESQEIEILIAPLDSPASVRGAPLTFFYSDRGIATHVGSELPESAQLRQEDLRQLLDECSGVNSFAELVKLRKLELLDIAETEALALAIRMQIVAQQTPNIPYLANIQRIRALGEAVLLSYKLRMFREC